MGTWSTNIKDDDTFLDVYQAFYTQYNNGANPSDISKELIEGSSHLINDIDTSNSFWFALSLAQWETKTLDPKVLQRVKKIIESGNDLKKWKGLDKSTIEKKKKNLEDFLEKINSEKEHPKRRIKPKSLDFYETEIIKLVSPDNAKTFTITESGTSKGYNYTGGYIGWSSGGGSIFFYDKPNRNIRAKWLDAHNLVIAHDKEIVFSKQDMQTAYYDDFVRIHYIPE